MTCRHFLLLLTLAVVSADYSPAAAHTGDRVFPILFLSEETLASLDLNDGTVEDWVDAVGPPTFTPVDFLLAKSSDWGGLNISYDQLDPSSLDFRIWMGWTRDGQIHVAGQFVDDVYVNEYEPLDFPKRDRYRNVVHAFDSISLLVDGDHTGGQYYFAASHGEVEEELKKNMQAQEYEAIARVPHGPMISLLGTTAGAIGFDELELEELNWMVQPPFARGSGGVYGENPTVWVSEFYVTCFDRLHHLDPDESVVSWLEEGKTVGFDLYVRDYDLEPGGPRAYYYLTGPDWGVWSQADHFADGLLLGPGDDFGDSAVQSTSWARIKASLEIDLRKRNPLPENN